MKYSLSLLLISTVLTSLVYAQSQNSFFPHKLGNKWIYATFDQASGTRDKITYEVVKDSLRLDGMYHVEISGWNSFAVSEDAVFGAGVFDTIKYFDFSAPMKSWWGPIELDTIFTAAFFGSQRTIIAFNHWFGDINNPFNRFIISTEYYANGLGLVQWDGFEATYRTQYLIGALIDSTRYGTLLSTEFPNQIDQPYLEQNYPNPFNSFTSIGFSLPSSCPIFLRVFDQYGRCVRTIVDSNYDIPRGKHSVFWNGRDDRGKQVPNGVYFIQLETNSGVFRKSALFVK